MITASHGLNLRVDVRTVVDPISDLTSACFVDLVCVGAGQNFALKTWEVGEVDAALFMTEPSELAAIMVRRIGVALR